ncbi:MAG: hypothetical protein Q8L39_04640 [Burkholderiales bacterium]|nr:hypothetical protein [Burkholderiales bacterium]
MAWIAEQLLTAISKAAPRDCITEAAVQQITKLNARQIEQGILKLRKHGLVEKVSPGCHKLTDAGREAVASGLKLRSGPKGSGQPGKRIHKDTLRIRVWRAIRIRRKFSIPDLVSLVAEGGERDIESNIRKYLSALTRAGILTELPRRDAGTALTSNGYKRWWLRDEKNSGPLAPVWRQGANTVYDPNTETEVAL